MKVDFSSLMVLLVIFVILIRGRRIDRYDAFLSGAKAGLHTAVSLTPGLCAMMLLLALFQSSGLETLLTRLISPLLRAINLPPEAAPLLLMRPLSGAGSLTVLEDIFIRCGPDSRTGRLASVLMGSSETILYTMTVYLGAAGVKRVPDAMWVSLVAYGVSVLVAAAVV